MKKDIFTLILVFIGLTLSSCNEFDQLTHFNLDVSSTVTIEPSFTVNTPFSVPTPPISNSNNQTFSSNNTSKDLIETVTLKNLVLTVNSPANEDFSILKSIEVYISADGEDDLEIAWANNIPDTTTVLKLNVSDQNLKKYLVKDNFSLKVNTVTDEVFSKEYQIKIASSFYVDAKILGL